MQVFATMNQYEPQVKVDTSRGLPIVQTRVNGIDASLFIDSGAKVNIVPRRELERLRIPAHLVRPVNVAIVGVAGKRVTPCGTVVLPFSLAGKRFSESFVVLEEVRLPADLLLSYTFLRKYGIVCDWDANVLYFKTERKLWARNQSSAFFSQEEPLLCGDPAEVVSDAKNRNLTCSGGLIPPGTMLKTGI